MDNARDTQLRQWAMLKAIPRYPRKVTAAEITQHLVDSGFNVSKRTVERDLLALSEIFPIVSDEREKPFGWSWQKEAPTFDLPAMSPIQALTLAMAQQYLQPLLPACLMDTLDPYVRAAEKTLGAGSNTRSLADWRSHIAVVPPTQPLLSPAYSGEVIETVHKALLEGRQLEIRYRSRSAGETKQYVAHPLGIVLRGTVTYLVATLFDYQDPRSLALHRIEAADILEAASMRPEGFELDQYIASGAFGFAARGPVRLAARIVEDVAAHLLETPLSGDQVVVPDRDGWVRVEATVNETEQLYWWLLAFGDNVEVLKPPQVRSEIKRILEGLIAIYQKGMGHESY